MEAGQTITSGGVISIMEDPSPVTVKGASPCAEKRTTEQGDSTAVPAEGITRYSPGFKAVLA